MSGRGLAKQLPNVAFQYALSEMQFFMFCQLVQKYSSGEYKNKPSLNCLLSQCAKTDQNRFMCVKVI